MSATSNQRRESCLNLQMQLFGALTVRIAGEPVSGLSSRSAGRVLAYLVLHHSQTVNTEALATTFWPQAESPGDSLRHGLSHLRGLLGDNEWRIDGSRGELRFLLEGASCDTADFDRLINADDLALVREAVDLYRGPLLEGWDSAWVMSERVSRHEKHLAALIKLARWANSADNHVLAADFLRRYVKYHPAGEEGRVLLMRALASAGERAAAMEVLRRTRELWLGRFGLPPPPAMVAMAEDLRALGALSISHRPGAAPHAAGRHIGGAVPLEAPYYIQRPVDAAFIAAVTRGDSIVLLQGPRFTGKSSLLARGLHSARQAGATVLLTDMRTLADADVEPMGALCSRLISSLAAQLDLEGPDGSFWSPLLGPTDNLDRFLQRHVLAKTSGPVVWALDEVDRLLTGGCSDELFSVMRSWHERRSLEPARAWKRLTVVLACAAEPSHFVRDLNRSPFNVGTRFDLTDFTAEQVAELNAAYGLPLPDRKAVDDFHALTGGHPHLVRRGIEEFASGNLDVGAFWRKCGEETGPFGDHLRRIVRLLYSEEVLKEAAIAVLAGHGCHESAWIRLRAAGVLAGDTAATAHMRCSLYSRYLSNNL